MLYQTSRPYRLKKTSSSSRNVASNIKVTYRETKEKIVNLLIIIIINIIITILFNKNTNVKNWHFDVTDIIKVK